MYPITFDNPNQSRALSQGWPVAANRNDSATPSPTTAPVEDAPAEPAPAEAHADSLLVVECRRDDKWRVELCTTLAELDGALDMARALRSAPDVDEVCLTLEVSGVHGRESRREVLRFAPGLDDTAVRSQGYAPAQSRVHAVQAAAIPAAPNAPDGGIGTEAMAVLQAALKAPDYCLDDIDFAPFAMPEPPAEQQSRTAARELLATIYSDHPDDGVRPGPFADAGAIRVELPDEPRPVPGFEPGSQPGSQPGFGHRLEADSESDDMAGLAGSPDSPLFGVRNALTAKLLVLAGAVALLVLGGAVAELLAVDITTAANAGVGVFDTLDTLQGDFSR